MSIDVDILSLESTERLKAVLDQATTDLPPFIGYEHQERRDREAPPTVHFRIPYSSALDPGGVHSIQLDVITAESPYAATEAKVVRASFFEIEEETSGRTPFPTASGRCNGSKGWRNRRFKRFPSRSRCSEPVASM